MDTKKNAVKDFFTDEMRVQSLKYEQEQEIFL